MIMSFFRGKIHGFFPTCFILCRISCTDRVCVVDSAAPGTWAEFLAVGLTIIPKEL